MNPTDLTDEQFREARRQIVERLCARGRSAMDQAVKSVKSAALNHQNPIGPFVQEHLDDARKFFSTAEWISTLERDGYVWPFSEDEG